MDYQNIEEDGRMPEVPMNLMPGRNGEETKAAVVAADRA